jgi:hypothetical protein
LRRKEAEGVAGRKSGTQAVGMGKTLDKVGEAK